MAPSPMGKFSQKSLYRNGKLFKNPNKAENKYSPQLPERRSWQSKEYSFDNEAELSTGQLLDNMSSSSVPRPGRGRRFSNVDCTKLFSGEIFEFIIGEMEVPFKVHDAALKGLSEPMCYMMSNSIMQESLTRTICISDHDPKTFAQFLKFAYLGFCGISDGVTDQVWRPKDLPTYFRCHYCSNSVSLAKNSNYPFHSPNCRVDYSSVIAQNLSYSAYCVVYGCANDATLDSSRNLLCASHWNTDIGRNYPVFRQASDPLAEAQSFTSCSADFARRQYGCGEVSHEELSRLLKEHESTGLHQKQICDVSLLEHAKLYVFAHQYMVDDLLDISLHKLHRNLTVTEITDQSINELIDLVVFSYGRTSDEGDIAKGSADRLRALVMAFVIDRRKELMAYHNFRDMIGHGGAQTADFFGLAFAT